MRKLLGLFVIVFNLILLSGCAESYEYEDVEGIVIEKEYDAAEMTSKTITDLDGEKIKVPVYKPEEYEVTIQYDTIVKEFEFEDDTFYNTVNVGDSVQLTLTKGLSAEGQIVSRQIDLPEDIASK